VKVVVCGGRAYRDAAHVYATLDAVHTSETITALAHGGAGKIGPLTGLLLGADRIAGAWAETHDIIPVVFPVSGDEWTAYGRAAGPRRNRLMLDAFKPDLVVAFPGGDGTADCCVAAEQRGIEVRRIAPADEA